MRKCCEFDQLHDSLPLAMFLLRLYMYVTVALSLTQIETTEKVSVRVLSVIQLNSSSCHRPWKQHTGNRDIERK